LKASLEKGDKCKEFSFLKNLGAYDSVPLTIKNYIQLIGDNVANS